MEIERNTMALMVNLNIDTKKHRPYTGKDFYKLSYDTVPQIENMSDAEVLATVKERFKKFIKKKDGR